MSTPSIFCPKKFRKLEKSLEGDADSSSSISHLPDEIILQILKKVIDLKTLCFCYLVSRRFSSIVLQVDAISFTVTVPRLNPPIRDNNTVSDVAGSRSLLPIAFSFYGKSLLRATRFLRKFIGVKSLCIELPSSSDRAINNHCLFKWKAKIGNRIESFMYLSPSSICDKDGFSVSGNGAEEEDNHHILAQCLSDVLLWHMLLMDFVKDLPMLERVSITDSWRRGRLSLSGKRLSEVKECVHSASETVLNRVGHCYIPVLNLPVSGYVMKGIHFGLMEMKDLHDGYDDLMNCEDSFEDKEEAAYTEALMEILEKHRGMMLMCDGGLV